MTARHLLDIVDLARVVNKWLKFSARCLRYEPSKHSRILISMKAVPLFLLVAIFAAPLGQVADIQQMGRARPTKMESKKKGCLVQLQHCFQMASDVRTTEGQPAIDSSPDVCSLEFAFIYDDVAGRVSIPPPRSLAV